MELVSFKAAREHAGLGAEDIARATRLSPRIVSAIEEERYDLLPAGIYARTAVRAYATAAGLDAEAALAHVQAQLPEAPLDLLAIAELRTSTERRTGRLRFALAAIVDAAVVLSMVAAVILVCSLVCHLMPTTLLKVGAAPIGVVSLVPVVLYFFLLGATNVRTVGPWLMDLDILPPPEGPLSLQVWAQRGVTYVLREAGFG
jgi:helix-turn-helix protein